MDHKIEKRIELKAPVSRVWRALTDHREFGQWFRVKIDDPFVPGQVSRGHMTYPGYEHVITVTLNQSGTSGKSGRIRFVPDTTPPGMYDQSARLKPYAVVIDRAPTPDANDAVLLPGCTPSTKLSALSM